MGGLPTSTVNGFAVHPTNPQLMWVAMRDGVLRSENAGVSWTPAARGPKDVAAVAVNPMRPDTVYAVTLDGHVFSSRDGGVTWDALR